MEAYCRFLVEQVKWQSLKKWKRGEVRDEKGWKDKIWDAFCICWRSLKWNIMPLFYEIPTAGIYHNLIASMTSPPSFLTFLWWMWLSTALDINKIKDERAEAIHDAGHRASQLQEKVWTLQSASQYSHWWWFSLQTKTRYHFGHSARKGSDGKPITLPRNMLPGANRSGVERRSFIHVP